MNEVGCQVDIDGTAISLSWNLSCCQTIVQGSMSGLKGNLSI